VPELPDVTIYIERLRDLVGDRRCVRVQVLRPFVLRTVTPAPADAEGRRVVDVSRIGKRIVLELEGELFFVLHLMIAGRLRWRPLGKKVSAQMALAAFQFENGVLWFTEASRQKRASLHVVAGRAALRDFERGGLEVMDATLAQFGAALRRRNHTLKRAVTDPTILSGIGNAYSDEILHAARLSPMKLTSRVSDAEMERLWNATRATLARWIETLRAEAGTGFPEKVTAFREGMAVHGRYRQPCPDCGQPVQRIRYASNECNYCARCQNEDRLLADRALSRLLREDWPKTLEELEERRRADGVGGSGGGPP
jgi:formamidopyrimidine-DNA glycosylase